MVSIDVSKKMLGGRAVYSNLGRKAERVDPVSHAQHSESAGAHSVSAGSMFAFHGPHRAVFMSYRDPGVIGNLAGSGEAALAG